MRHDVNMFDGSSRSYRASLLAAALTHAKFDVGVPRPPPANSDGVNTLNSSNVPKRGGQPGAGEGGFVLNCQRQTYWELSWEFDSMAIAAGALLQSRPPTPLND